MDRLLMLKLDTLDCEGEAWINGIAVARADAQSPGAVVPIHEYTVSGTNRLELVLGPRPVGAPAPPQVLAGDGKRCARVSILLPRDGHPVDEASARSVAQLAWTPAAGERYETPLHLGQDIALPVSFPRWCWLDAQPADAAALQSQALALVQQLARELGAGQSDGFLAATRLRTEELAAAYQRPGDEAVTRVRDHLAGLHAAGALRWQPLEPESFTLRRLAGGRLLDCLGPRGEPALRTVPDAQGEVHAFPLRLAAMEGKLYVLR